MNRDRINFIWFVLAGLAVAAIVFLHPFTIIQTVSFVLLAGFFFYLAWESFQFEHKDNEYGHSTGIEIHPFISKLIRSAAMTVPALLLIYLLGYLGLQMTFKPGPITNPAVIEFTKMERSIFGERSANNFSSKICRKVITDLREASASGQQEEVIKGVEFLNDYLGYRFSCSMCLSSRSGR